MAIVACGNRVMAGLYPSVVLRLHDMAVGASLRIVREVGISPGVNKGIKAESDYQSSDNSEA